MSCFPWPATHPLTRYIRYIRPLVLFGSPEVVPVVTAVPVVTLGKRRCECICSAGRRDFEFSILVKFRFSIGGAEGSGQEMAER